MIPEGLNSTPVESTPAGVDSRGVEFIDFLDFLDFLDSTAVEFNPRGINTGGG